MKKADITTLANKQEHQYTDEDWEGHWDANTLAKAEIIKGDPDRLKRARLWAGVISGKEAAEAAAFKKIANG